jgi:hypothetical protein
VFLRRQNYAGSNFCHSPLESLDLRAPAWYHKPFFLHVYSSSKNCLSARCPSAANVVCADVDKFGIKTDSFNYVIMVLCSISKN